MVGLRQKLSENRSFSRADGTGFWEFLEAEGIPYTKADFPFLTATATPRVKPVFDLGEYLELTSRGEALAYLYKGLGKALNYVGPVLDTELPHGFNDHTDRHTLWVSQTGVELLQRAGMAYDKRGYFDAKTEVLMTLVGMLHDIGNLLGREAHSERSLTFIEQVFAGMKSQRSETKAVLYAVKYHEEPILQKDKKALKQGIPLQWALVLADKMHVGRERIGGRSFEAGLKERAFENDVHILLESLVVRSSWHLRAGSFKWNLDFSVDQLEDRFASFTKGGGRLWMPRMLQKLFLNQGKMYRESFRDLFVKTYGARMKMASEAAFLLFPYLTRFEVRLTDTDTRGKVGSGELIVWGKGRRK